MNSKHATVKDVAQLAGVSVGTVSKVLNGFQSRPAAMERIRSAIRTLNYAPNMYARATRLARSNCLGMLVEMRVSQDAPWIQSEITRFISAAAERGWRAMLEYWDSSQTALPRLMNCVDGYLIRGPVDPSFLKILEKNGMPPVVYPGDVNYPNLIRTSCSFENAFRDALRHLAELGHRRAVFVLGELIRNKELIRTFLKSFSMEAEDRQFMQIDPEERQGAAGENGFRCTLEILRRVPDATAIIYGSDCIALGGMGALLQQGISVPHDMSVISFDNSFWAAATHPSVTSIAPPENLMERQIDALIEKIKGSQPGMTMLRGEYRLIERETTGPAPADAGTKERIK